MLSVAGDIQFNLFNMYKELSIQGTCTSLHLPFSMWKKYALGILVIGSLKMLMQEFVWLCDRICLIVWQNLLDCVTEFVGLCDWICLIVWLNLFACFRVTTSRRLCTVWSGYTVGPAWEFLTAWGRCMNWRAWSRTCINTLASLCPRHGSLICWPQVAGIMNPKPGILLFPNVAVYQCSLKYCFSL